MKIPVFLLLLSFIGLESFSLVNKSNQSFTNVYHYRNNITLKNFDGTSSTIYVNEGSATLFNADGTQSTINTRGNFSTLIAIDGTNLSITHNGSSSRISKEDGTQLLVNHMNSTSLCITPNGKHTIMHTFGNVKEIRYKDKIDVLIHVNWLLQKEAAKAADTPKKEQKEEQEN